MEASNSISLNRKPRKEVLMKLMMKCKSGALLAAALLSLAFSSTAHAQEPKAAPAVATAAPAALPSSDEVVKHYVQAVGGNDAWRKLNTRQIVGTIDIPAMNISGTLESHEKAPNKMLSVVVIAGATFRRGFDGKAGWADDPQNGLRDMTGDELRDTVREADFYRPLDLQTIYSKMTVTGTDKVGDHDVYVVDAAPAQGDADKLFFDKQSGLLVKSVLQQHTPQGAVTIQEEMSDYRDADGVKIPFSLKQSTPQIEFTIKVTEIHHNVSLDDAQFAKPAAQ
jgi:zinc protease